MHHKAVQRGIPLLLTFAMLFLFSVSAMAAEVTDNSQGVYNERLESTITPNQNYIVEVAFAFYEKGLNTQYEMQKMCKRGMIGNEGYGINIRREPYAVPGEISDDKITYFDCSGFVFAVYNTAFGDTVNRYTSTKTMMDIAQSATSVGAGNEVVYRYLASTSGALSEETASSISNEMKALLEPGDIIVYRRGADGGTYGHTVLYLGAKGGKYYTLESVGASYNYTTGIDNVEANGTLSFRNANSFLFNYSSTACPFNKSNFASIAILRPLAVSDPAPVPTEQGIAYGASRGLSVTKRGLPVGQSAARGEEITYTITLDNAYRNYVPGMPITQTVTVTDPLSSNVTFVSATDGGSVVNGNVVFNVTVGAGVTKTLSYTVRVNNTATGKVTGTVGNANGIEFTCYDVTIGPGMTEAQETALDTALSAGKSSSTTALAWINSIYQTVLGKDFSVSTDSALFNAIFATSGSYYTVRDSATQANVDAALLEEVTGGYYVTSVAHSDHKDRIRYVSEGSFKYGDVFATVDISGNYAYYIYRGSDSAMLKVTDGAVTTADTATVLEGALALSRFALLRPSLMQDSSANYVAKLGTTSYVTLSDAIAAAEATDAVDDIYLLRDIVFKRTTTISTDGKTRFVVADGKDIVVKGPVTFNGPSSDAESLLFRCTGTGSVLTIKDGVTIQGYRNIASGSNNNNRFGAVIRVDSSASLNLDGVTIQNCSGPNRGAVYVNTSSPVCVSNCTFTNNAARTGYGGAIASYTAGVLTVQGCSFTGNTAAENGGAIGIFAANATLTVTDCSFNQNNAVSGGAIHLVDSTTSATITGSTFDGNTSSDDGSALLMIGSVTVDDCTFQNNVSSAYGTIRNDGATAVIKNTSIINNKTANKTGVAIHNNTGTLTLENVIITGNTKKVAAADYNEVYAGNGVTLKGNNTIGRISIKTGTPLTVVGTVTGDIKLYNVGAGTTVLTGTAANVAASAAAFTGVVNTAGTLTNLAVNTSGVVYTAS